jgi:hypothetical protein
LATAKLNFFYRYQGAIMFEQVLVPSENNATITLPVDLYGLEVKVTAIPVERNIRLKASKRLLPPHINTSGWKFNREEANER